MSSAGYHFGAPPSSSTTSTTSATEAGTGGLQSSLWLHLAAAAAAASQNHQHPTIPNISVKEPHRYHLQILSMTTSHTPAAIKSSLKFNLLVYFFNFISTLRFPNSTQYSTSAYIKLVVISPELNLNQKCDSYLKKDLGTSVGTT